MSGKSKHDEVKRFLSRVRKAEKCWEWIGPKTPRGYGKLWVNGKLMYAHRFSYFHHLGNFDQAFLVCHHCDNPSCVNPKHLFLGTHADNIKDMSRKGRAQRGRFSVEQIRNIKNRIASGETKRSIAKNLGVNETLICMIDKGKRYMRELREIALN